MAIDNFFKLDDCPGESKDDKHPGEIEVLSFSWGASQAGSGALGGGIGTTKVTMHDVSCTTYLGKHGPKLQQKCFDGSHIPKGVLTCRKAGEKPLEYLTYTFEKLMVTSYQIQHSGDSVPIENWTLCFETVKVLYKEQDDKGGMKSQVPAGWDLKANKPI
jgi:type VI secretion system secreted protein Hcp